MPKVKLNGQLICQTPEQLKAVERLVEQHVADSRAEEGCLSFDITPTKNPLVWNVDEIFDSESAYQAHKARMLDSDWYESTKGIKREYNITLIKGAG